MFKLSIGTCLIHLILIFNGSDAIDIQNDYSNFALRVNQIFYLFALISTIGAVDNMYSTKKQCKRIFYWSLLIR